MPGLQSPISVTYGERIGYDTSTIVIGQCFLQTDEIYGFPAGYYFWTPLAWLYAGTQIGAQTIWRGEGPHLFASQGLFIYNLAKSAEGAFLLISNATDNDALFGYFDGAFVGMEISEDGETGLSSRLGQILGLWSRDSSGNLVRLMDLKYDQANNNRVSAALRYGDGTVYGLVPCYSIVDLSEPANSGSSETDAETQTIEANSLVSNGSGLRFRLHGVTAANGNNKRARLVVGSLTIADTGSVAANDKVWRIEAQIWRTAAGTIKYEGWAFFSGSAPTAVEGSGSLDLTIDESAIAKLTGGASNDIYVKSFSVEAFF